jgi:nitrogen regulatory protein P-II 1
MSEELSYDLIVTVVPKGDSERIVEASKRAGAEGATILGGRGTGIHEQGRFLGIPIEPEKELVLTLIEKDKSEAVFESIIEAGLMDQPCTGICFVVDIKKVAGIFHACSM